jgi:putative ABC transport system permease protein
MSTALLERPVEVGTGDGGRPARRAVVPWAWRLFRHEWRQQPLVLALLTAAVAATTLGLAVASNATPAPETKVSLPGTDPLLSADLAAFQRTFGRVEVVAHQTVAIPGSVATVDLRAQDPQASPTPRLLAGRYPSGPHEMALTRSVATIFNVRPGDTWTEGGRALRVAGLVQNPENLRDGFALVAPGQATPPANVTVLLHSDRRLNRFRLPSGLPLIVESASAAKTAAAVAVLALATMGLLFVGLVAVAGFTVMAQRRQRALGMLGSLGATDHHIRLVTLADGAAVGAMAAVTGAAAGLLSWIAFAPHLETVAAHRFNRFNLPWWAIGTAIALAVLTAVAAAWWPARSAARLSVVAALSGRPPRPQPAHRSPLWAALPWWPASAS